MPFTTLFQNDFWSMTPEFFRVFSLSALLMFGAIVGTSQTSTSDNLQLNHTQDSNPIITPIATPIVTRSPPILGALMFRLTARTMRLAAGLVYSNMLMMNLDGSGLSGLSGTTATTRFSGIRIHDAASEGAKLVILLATAGCRLGTSAHAVRLGRYAFEYPVRIGLATLGLRVMVSANDLIARYLGLEWQSLCLYVLAAFRRGSAYSTEAGLKYFILGAVASGVLLFGSSLVYGATGSLNYGVIGLRGMADQSIKGADPMLAVGMSRVLSAFFFKLAVAPFHAWTPDVYEGSPTSSTLYFAVVPKMAVVCARDRILFGAFQEMFQIYQPMRIAGAARSRLVGALNARVQYRIKRFRAYSAISHVGYILLGLSSGTLEGVQASRVYRILYVVMSLNVWLAILSISRVRLSPSGEETLVSAKYRMDLAGLSRLNPFLAASLSVSVRSMAGIPPLAGFMAKLWIFFAAISQSLVLVSVFAILCSSVGAFYYRRWIKVIYFEPRPSVSVGNGQMISSLDRPTSRVMGTTFMRIMVAFLYPAPLRLLTHRMALSICRG